MRLAAVIVVGLVFAAVPAGAAAVYTIHGTVTDRLGNPVVGAYVWNDFGTLDLTDEYGRYELEITIPSTYDIWVSKTDFVHKGRRVDPVDALEPVDFVLSYTLDFATVEPRAFPASVQSVAIETKSGVPIDACIQWTDSAGAAVDLSPAERDSLGRRSWRAMASVAGRTDGLYAHTIRAYDCESRIEIADGKSSTYVVDSIAPTLSALHPADGSTVAAGRISISAIAVDDRSRIDPFGFQYSVEDLDGGDIVAVPHDTWDYPSGTIRSAFFTILDGRTYRIRVRTVDYAGNETVAESTFRAGPPVPPEVVTRTAPYDHGSRCAAGGATVAVTICSADDAARTTGRVDIAFAAAAGVVRNGVFVDVNAETAGEITATIDATVDGIGTVCVEVADPRVFSPLARACSATGAPTVTVDIPSPRLLLVRAWFEAVRQPPPAEVRIGAGHASINSIAYTFSR